MRYACFYEIFSRSNVSNGERKTERGNAIIVYEKLINAMEIQGILYCKNKETHCLSISVRL